MCTDHKKGVSAYMSVEASLVIPVILLIYSLVIYISFFMYDRCISLQDACILSVKESVYKTEEGLGQDQHLTDQWTRLKGGKYFMVQDLSCSSEIGHDHVSCRIRGNLHSFRLESGASISFHDPPAKMRRLKRSLDLIRGAGDTHYEGGAK